MVLAPRRWRQVGDDASYHGDDGGKRARSPGRLRISRKTIAQGRPVDPPVPVVLPRAFFARGPWVHVGTRPSLRPLDAMRAFRSENSDAMRRGNTNSRLR